MSNKYKPVLCCVGYNRPNSMERLLKSLGNASYDDDDITLIVSVDKDKEGKSEEVVKVAESFVWRYGEKRIISHEKNMGLKAHILECGDYSVEFGSIIMLEDDVVVAPGFYKYMQAALEFYDDCERVFGIGMYAQGWWYSFQLSIQPFYKGDEVFLGKYDITSGQGWTGKRWLEYREWLNDFSGFKYNKEVKKEVISWSAKTSWAKYLNYYMVESNRYYAIPYVAYSVNANEAGTHATSANDELQVPLSFKERDFDFPIFEESIRYDNHFEREDSFTDTICDIPFEKICVNLNASKYDWSGYEYILTTQKLPYEKVGSFGCHMEPIELNIIYEVPGGHICLYKVPRSGYRPPHSIEEINLRQEIDKERMFRLLNRFSMRSLLYGVRRKIKNKMLNRRKI